MYKTVRPLTSTEKEMAIKFLISPDMQNKLVKGMMQQEQLSGRVTYMFFMPNGANVDNEGRKSIIYEFAYFYPNTVSSC